MADLTPVCDGIAVFTDTDVATVLAHDEPVATFRRRADSVSVALVMATGRAHDVSRQPRTVSRRLRDEATRRRSDPNRWVDATARHLGGYFTDIGVPNLPHGTGLDPLCAALAFPLIRAVLAAGCAAPPTVPAWASEALQHDTIDHAIAALFDRPITSGLRRSVRNGLLAGAEQQQPIALAPFGVASTLPLDWAVDHVATVAAGQGWLPPAAWPTVEQRSDLCRIWRWIPPDAGVRLCRDALSTPTGIVKLWTGLRLCETALANGHRAPTTVAGLVDLAEQEAVRLRLPETLSPSDRWNFAVAVELMDGHCHGAYQFVLPRTPDQLRQWSAVLDNCLDLYIDAIARGQCYIVGLFDGANLVAALELTGDLKVAQFSSVHNDRVTREQMQACRRMLSDVGIDIG